MSSFKEKYSQFCGQFEDVLADYLKTLSVRPNVLREGICYALGSGGKRVRPVLMFACAVMLGGKIADISDLALALEMIHSYSLAHDDLPAMDDDDFRRGKPSLHKQFGEGQAILIGDALLNEAYLQCLNTCKKGRSYLNASLLICENAGKDGMVAGQSADLYYEGNEEFDEKSYEFIVLNKTARMIVSAVAAPALVYNTDENITNIIIEYGKNLGRLFQLTDDILDVTGDFKKLGKTIGKDEKEKKLSAVRLYGIEKCNEQADHLLELCLALLRQLPFECSFLEDFTKYLRCREK